MKYVVEELPDGTDDARIGRIAKRERRVVLTCDHDFWDDKLTSFRETGGVFMWIPTVNEVSHAQSLIAVIY